jgi:translation elongation factor EF-Tu-like GTPase
MKAIITLISTEGRINPILPGYRPSFRIGTIQSDCQLTNFSKISPGETGKVDILILHPEKFTNLRNGDIFILTEGNRKVANGVLKIDETE